MISNGKPGNSEGEIWKALGHEGQEEKRSAILRAPNSLPYSANTFYHSQKLPQLGEKVPASAEYDGGVGNRSWMISPIAKNPRLAIHAQDASTMNHP